MGVIVGFLGSFLAFSGVSGVAGLYSSGVEGPYVVPAIDLSRKAELEAGVGTRFTDIPWWYGYIVLPARGVITLPGGRDLSLDLAVYSGIEGYALEFTGYDCVGKEMYKGMIGNFFGSVGLSAGIGGFWRLGSKINIGAVRTLEYDASFSGSFGVVYEGRKLPIEVGLAASDVGIFSLTRAKISLFGKYEIKTVELRAGVEGEYAGSEATTMALNEAVVSAGWKGNGLGVSFGGANTGIFIFSEPTAFLGKKNLRIVIRGGYSFIIDAFDLFFGVGYRI